jgi:hypothetical protein
MDAENRAAGDAQSARTDDGPSVALVLADRSTLVDQAAGAVHPDTVTSKGRQLSGNGRSAGYQAGQRADLGTSRNVETGRGALAGA